MKEESRDNFSPISDISEDYEMEENDDFFDVDVEVKRSGDEEANGFISAPRTAPPPPPYADSTTATQIQEKVEKKREKKKKAAETWKRSSKIPNTPFLFIGDTEQLPIKGTQIAVTVDGFRARVLIDCFFYNDEKSQREGTFKMRLPQGASPYYFAFGESAYESKNGDQIPVVEYEQIDFSPEGIENMRSSAWKNPKEAKIVKKEKAAFAYHNTVRRKVDPALAEFAGADLYNCRVFPLLPQKLHRIVMGYDMDLSQLDEDWLLNFSVPAVDCEKIMDFEVAEIAGINSNIQPQVDTEMKNNYKKFRFINPSQKEISIRYNGLGNMLLQTASDEKQRYFAAAVTPNLPVTSQQSLHKNAIFALDISLSSEPDKFNIWLKLIEEILRNNKNIETFNVLLFNVESFWWKSDAVANSNQNINAFLNDANNLALEGASDLGLALSDISNHKNGNNIFLLSDAAITWGTSDHHELSNFINDQDIIFAYNTGMSGTSKKTLEHLTRKSGGSVFSVVNENEIKKASKAHNNQPWKIESIQIKGGSDFIIAGRPQYIYAGQKLIVSGRATNNITPRLNLVISQNGNKKNLDIPFKNQLNSELTARIFGQIATNQLEEFNQATKDYSVSYAKHFKVPGKTCSMLMLETEQDYKQYNIDITEDQFVVKSSSVNQLISDVLSKIGNTLSSAKVNFENWMENLAKMPGVSFEKTTSLDLLCKQMSEADFQVAPKGLSCKSRNKSDVSSSIRKALLATHLDYDLMNHEAQKRKEKYGSHDALKILSSLVEKKPGDGVLARDVAFSALEWNLNEQAYFLLKRVLVSRPYEPQTYHAIAQALSQAGKKELALLYYEIAITANWDGRFGEFKKIASLDYLNFLKEMNQNSSFKLKDFAEEKIKKLEDSFDEKEADVLVTISWNTDNTDIDLHVKEPTGEVCFYKNKTTKIGGQITKDVTQGYGPEMYVLKKSKKGEYKISVNYYSSDTNRTSTRTKVYATIYKNWGKENEEVIKKVVTLKKGKEMHDVLEVEL